MSVIKINRRSVKYAINAKLFNSLIVHDMQQCKSIEKDKNVCMYDTEWNKLFKYNNTYGTVGKKITYIVKPTSNSRRIQRANSRPRMNPTRRHNKNTKNTYPPRVSSFAALSTTVTERHSPSISVQLLIRNIFETKLKSWKLPLTSFIDDHWHLIRSHTTPTYFSWAQFPNMEFMELL